MGGRCRVVAAALVGTASLLGPSDALPQVVAEPAMLTAGIPAGETFLPYIAFPENSLVLGGMIRFPLTRDVDLGGRAGLWLIDDASDTPYAGVDLRYGLLARELSTGGGLLNVSFDFGLGLSDPGPTVWKIPLGFLTGVGFQLAGGDSEIFASPRLELGIRTGEGVPDVAEDNFDAALLLDVGGLFTITPALGAMIDLRFGNGIFLLEGDQVVVGVGAVWRL